MKESKPKEQRNIEPKFGEEEFTYGNMLALPPEIKTYLIDQSLDWRFLNASQFRAAGNYHRSHWKPLNVKEHPPIASMAGSSAEGLIQRGDLILGVRTKALTAKHKEFLNEKNRRYGNFAKDEAKKMRDEVRRKGLEGVTVKEGYDEDEKGFA